MKQRLRGLTLEELSPEQAEVAKEIVNGPRGQLRGPFAVLIRNPNLMQCIQKLGEQIRFNSSFGDALREWAILVTAHYYRQEYEWSVHEALAKKAGVLPELIDQLVTDKPISMSADEALIYDCCSQLCDNGNISDVLFDALNKRWGETMLVELVTLVGYYSMLGMVLSVAGTPPITSRENFSLISGNEPDADNI